MTCDECRMDPCYCDTVVEPSYGFCNSCGEEMWEGDDCCDDGEWTPLEDAS